MDFTLRRAFQARSSFSEQPLHGRAEQMVTNAAAPDSLELPGDLPEDAEDTAALVEPDAADDAETPPENAATAWEDAEENREHLRAFKRQFFENVTDKMLSYLDGKIDSDKLSSNERRTAKKYEAFIEQRVQTRLADYGTAETPQQMFDRLYVEFQGMDPYTRMERIEQDRDAGAWWARLLAWKHENGVPADAPLERIHAIQAQMEADKARKASAERTPGPDDLDALYEEFTQDDAWGLLTDAERDELDPDNFNAASPVKAKRAMTAAFERITEAAAERRPRNPRQEAAKALLSKTPPGVSGGRGRGTLTFEQARDAMLANPSPATKDAYERARKAAGLS